ncbi:arylsulfatase [Rhodopirellula maiorica SM1]|uniref:Arylsulfatase n=1 Tax=Rhodopirellula maiorica SM1 TaxID=1265738 RepID=M5RTN3_9BACT|nr:arylsulfatase [Rhodopirellula maiorica SM1]
MVDDLGFSDIGCYGSEIETPNLDALARNGVRFSQFYNTAKCHSSRVSLLTGQYCIAAGDTKLTHAVTSAEVLGDAGYFTAMTGKWHLARQPTDFGFQRYFGHLSGACNYFSGDNTFRLNGEPWQVPSEGFYTTVANVDYALDFLDEARTTDKPWYLYVAFNAPHAPLHALPEDYKQYQGKYDHGWEAVRDARIAKQKRLGVLPESLEPSPRPEHVPAWNDLEPWKRDYEANRMTTLAAMIDRVDQEVGRLVADLKKNDELENTFILFVSDNGACPYDRKPAKLNVEPTSANVSFGDSTGWAWARNSPFRYYKQNQFEGGISTPAIVHWPAGLKLDPGDIVPQPAHLIDVLPTLADLAETEIPDSHEDRQLRPVSGISLEPLLRGESLESRPPIHLLFAADRGLRDGDWKLVSFQSEAWELYNVAEDRCELNNLADQHPERLNRMIATWNEMAKDVVHAPAKASMPVKEASLPHRHREWTYFDAETPEQYQKKRQANAGSTKKGKSANLQSANHIRARKNTALKIAGNELRLQFSGEDPGIAMDLRNKPLPDGPYQITFKLRIGSKANAAPDGEIFYTTDTKTTLPKGRKVPFAIESSDEWQTFQIPIAESNRIYQLRIDIGDGPGSATITDLQLLGSEGKTLQRWPQP